MQESHQSTEGGARKEGMFASAKKVAVPFLVFACLFATGAAVYFYTQTISLRGGDSQAISREKVEKLVSEVSKLMILPEGELPTVATIKDLEPLKVQPFFANAQVGDMLLIYEQARKAIIYSPSKRKIVEVGPVTPAPAPTSAPVEKK